MLRLDYPPELPISEHRAALVKTIRENQVVVVAGETGSGKSTQLPKLAYEARHEQFPTQMIGHTQPRRIAARALAQRIADETETTLGHDVGFAVRFDDRTRAGTAIKLMTDGILLAEIGRDADLSNYHTIIVDEAHERSLNIDFLLGYLHRLLARRRDLHLIITSATIDTARFADHFRGPDGPAPIVSVEGRTYPVEIRYRPPEPGVDQPEAISDAVDELLDAIDGDILVFCSGEREIADAVDAIADAHPHLEVLPLFARLSASEQQRIFAAHGGRRVIVATNIAETSITVPRVRAVIDTGTARISRFSARTKIQRLPIEAISQASANQRSGRCGRIGPGIAIRLYAEEDFDGRAEFSDPEIVRTNLAAVLLIMARGNLGEVSDFAFIDPPEHRQITDGIALLHELAAVRDDESHIGTRRWLTQVGHQLVRLPLDPRLGRMVVEANRLGVADAVLPIVARLSIADPRERPGNEIERAQQHHARFNTDDSDFMAILRLWEYLDESRRDLSSSKFRRMCRREYLHYVRVREWQDLVSQLRRANDEMLAAEGSRGRSRRSRGRGSGREPTAPRGGPSAGPARADATHQALLSGLITHVGSWDERQRRYRGVRHSSFRVGRESVARRSRHDWIMAAEMVETTDTWARICAPIRLSWLERAADHLVSKSYSEPEWDPKGGSAVARERRLLFGLALSADRRRQLSAIDFDLARSFFLDFGLVRGEWPDEFEFIETNAETVSDLLERAARTRRPVRVELDDLLIDHYHETVPPDIGSLHQFRSWWRGATDEHKDTLLVSEDWLLARLAADDDPFDFEPDDYPDHWPYAPEPYPLVYVHEPGTAQDGVTLSIPLTAIGRLDPAILRWHIPGMRDQMVDVWLRSLPKEDRKALSPITETIAAVIATIAETTPGQNGLSAVLSDAIYRVAQHRIPTNVLDAVTLPDPFIVRVSVVNERGDVVAEGRDVVELQARLADLARDELSERFAGHRRAHMVRWDCGDIARSIGDSPDALAYPALVDHGDWVALELFPDADEAAAQHWLGVRRLLVLSLPQPGARVMDRLDTAQRLALSNAPYAGIEGWIHDCVEATVDHLAAAAATPRTPGEFERLLGEVRAGYGRAVLDTAARSAAVIERWLAMSVRIGALRSESTRHAKLDMHEQLLRLVYPGFVAGVGVDRLDDLMRYLRAIEFRLDKLAQNVGRDAHITANCREVEGWITDAELAGASAERVERAVWMAEELRVSLFAQSVGTPEPVSAARIERVLQLDG